MFSCTPGWPGTCYVAEDDLIPLMLRLERCIATAEGGVMLTITSNPSLVRDGYPTLALNSGDPLLPPKCRLCACLTASLPVRGLTKLPKVAFSSFLSACKP